MRVLAIDYGDARTGIAVSDLTGSIVGRTEVIHSRNAQKTAEAIRALAAETGAQALVMGFPRNMDGSEGPRAALYREFAALVEQVCAMPVTLWDERRTTVDAHRILGAQGVRAKNRKDKIDSVAATLILEGFLDWKRLQAQRQKEEQA